MAKSVYSGSRRLGHAAEGNSRTPSQLTSSFPHCHDRIPDQHGVGVEMGNAVGEGRGDHGWRALTFNTVAEQLRRNTLLLHDVVACFATSPSTPHLEVWIIFITTCCLADLNLIWFFKKYFAVALRCALPLCTRTGT